MTRTSRRALAVPAILALAAVAATAPASADPRGPIARAAGTLSDLQPAAGPFDGARAAVQFVASGQGSYTCCACAASTTQTGRPSARTCTPARASPATVPPPSATTTPTSSRATPPPRSARTPRCGWTSRSTTAPAPPRHPCRSSAPGRPLGRHPRPGDRPPHGARRRPSRVPPGPVVTLRAATVGGRGLRLGRRGLGVHAADDGDPRVHVVGNALHRRHGNGRRWAGRGRAPAAAGRPELVVAAARTPVHPHVRRGRRHLGPRGRRCGHAARSPPVADGAGAALVGLTLWGVVVEDLGLSMSVRQWLGVAVMTGCLAVMGWAARELVRRWPVDAARRLPLDPSATSPTLVGQPSGR
jgi:hypothetical protein